LAFAYAWHSEEAENLDAECPVVCAVEDPLEQAANVIPASAAVRVGARNRFMTLFLSWQGFVGH
jgi:hypothetical protein